MRDDIAVYEATVTGDYAGALKAIADPKLDAPAPLRAAIQAALQALVAGDSSAKARAAPALVALPPDMQGRVPASLLGALGANREALQQVASGVANRRYNATGWLFVPSMSGALRDPSFPALADRLGLMKYWRATKTRPDVCAAAAAPPVCRMI